MGITIQDLHVSYKVCKKVLKLTRASLLMLMLCNQTTYAGSLPDFGDSAQAILSKQQEQALGKMVMIDIRQHLPLVQDLYTEDYINTIGKRIASYSSVGATPFHFFVVEDNTINAFALPGGNIGVHSQLILSAQSEDELAGVLSHEIAHVTQHHIARMYERSSKMTLPTLAAIISSIALATQNPSAGTGALAATMAGAEQMSLNFSRENEQEADRIGLQTMTQAGFNPHGMPDFFGRMQQSNRFNQSNYPEFLRTHPVTEARIADSRARAERYKLPSHGQSNQFALIKARVDILGHNNPQEKIIVYQTALNQHQYQDEETARYGYALALYQANRFDEAKTELKRLIKHNPDQVLFTSLLADTLLHTQKGNEALAILKEQALSYPDNRALQLQYARTLMEMNQAIAANIALKKQLQKFPASQETYQLLAESSAKAGVAWQAHTARGEYLILEGDYDNALRQYDMALKLADKDNYLSASLKARIKAIKQEEATTTKS